LLKRNCEDPITFISCAYYLFGGFTFVGRTFVNYFELSVTQNPFRRAQGSILVCSVTSMAQAVPQFS